MSKHVSIGFIGLSCLVALAAASAACVNDGAAGEPGPAGPAGAAGAVGAAGATGAPGAPGSAAPTPPPPPSEAPKAVYTLSNDATSNAIFVYERASDGTLTPKDAYATGGKGTASGLGDQGALVFDAKSKSLFAVNAGDDSISMMALHLDGSLSLVAKISSGGVKPISVTVSGDVVYALNAGDAPTPANVSGFRVSPGGLERIAASTQPLGSASPAPAQIAFTPDGKMLVVTEKATDMIDTYAVTDGVAAAPIVQASSGKTPFGFAFASKGQLVVSEAFGGADGAGAASTYALTADGHLVSKSASVVSTQSAPCWVTIAANRAYVTNTKSNTVSAYTIADDGAMTLLGATAAQTGAGPIDAAITEDAALLYTLDAKDHQISAFAIAADGTLTKRSALAGLPESAVGLVAR